MGHRKPIDVSYNQIKVGRLYQWGIDQAAEVGYEMVNFSFGSGFNPEDESEKNYEQMKKYAEYAEQRN